MTDSHTPEGDTRHDEWLVVRCQLGERAGFDALIERWYEPLWKYARRVTGDEDAAHDAVQDIWVRVLRALGRLRDGTRLRPWLFSIARHVLMDRLRDQYAAPQMTDLDGAEASPVEEPSGHEDDLVAMEDELARLPLHDREVLTLFYLRELSLTQVAALLEVPVGTVKSRLFRARRALRRGLGIPGRLS
ncbi:MAG: sigma-70 family RNA polymerase sigma factor [Vicinamibacterales bacterium]